MNARFMFFSKRLLLTLLLLTLITPSNLIFYGLAEGAAPARPSADRTVGLWVDQARATYPHDTDDLAGFYPQQDFVVEGRVHTGSAHSVGPVEDRDWATFEPNLVITETVPITRYIKVVTSLWDDDGGTNETFDINPLSPYTSLDLRFDTCTFHLKYPDLSDVTSEIGLHLIPQGHDGDDTGQVSLLVQTDGGMPFTKNDVAIVDISPVQAVFKPDELVANKATALRIDIASTWSETKWITITGSLSDGNTSVKQTESITIPANTRRPLYLFDNSDPHSLPYYPHKGGGNHLHYEALMQIAGGEVPVDPDPIWADCWDANNESRGQLPIVETHAPITVYAPFDLLPSVNYPSLTQMREFASNSDRYIQAVFPIDHTTSVVSPIPILWPPALDLVFRWGEPLVSIVAMSLVFSLTPVDRWVLVTRPDWWKETLASGLIFVGSESTIGMSAGEFGPYAVIAVSGHMDVGAHELGHTYLLSQRKCDSDFLGVGCRDEYNHPTPPRPYMAFGLDVLQTVFPSGLHPRTPGTREIFTENFMGNGYPSPTTTDKWIDRTSFNWLMHHMTDKADPTILTLSGYVHFEGDLSNPSGLTGELMPSFQSEGTPLFDGKLGEVEGGGVFAVRLTTPSGDYLYRFTPLFSAEGSSTSGVGGFSFSVPWDPSITGIELYGPTNIVDPGSSEDNLLDAIDRSDNAPTIDSIQAKIVGEKPLPTPHLGPGQTLNITWVASDLDSTELTSVLLLDLGKVNGGFSGFIPVAMTTENSLEIPYSQLMQGSGVYSARLFVSDGVNSTYMDVSELFAVDSGLYLPLVAKSLK
jgi:hypothetical protein